MTITTAGRGLIAGAAVALVVGIGATSVAAQPAQIAGTAVAAGVSIAEVPAVRPVAPVVPVQPGYGHGGSPTATTGTATTAQQVGVVDIDTVLSYAGAEAAGTGLVLTSTGEILTNNHVVVGSTGIVVTIVSSGRSYPATVVGTDATADVAVLQLTGASGLATANLAESATVAVGDAVTGVGNAGGVGGRPAAAAGTVRATGQSITTQAEGSAAAETLSGLIETDADIQAGDSGGPLFNADDQVVGIDTAAQSGGPSTAGYAIPISTALGIADQIEAGQASQTIVIGYPAFLGVQVAPARYRYSRTGTAGALISGVVSGGPAEAAGLSAGDTITALGGTAIADSSALSTTLAGDAPGQSVTITWVSSAGATQSATVTLATGPAA